MKIRITQDVPVAADVKPKIGSVHEVEELAPMPNGKQFYMIRMGITRIGIADHECEVMPPGKGPAVVTPHQSRE